MDKILSQPKSDDYRFYKLLAESVPTTFASIVGMITEGSDEPVLERPVIDIRGSVKPISLPVRARLPHRTKVKASSADMPTGFSLPQHYARNLCTPE